MKQNEYYQMFRVEDSHFWYLGMRTITETLIKSYLADKKKLKILDAGCGTGAGMLWLSNYGEVSGVDLSALAIELCRKRGIKNVKVGSIEKLPFKSNSFDLIISSDVLGQMEVGTDRTAIAEFDRVLKPEGVLILRTAAFNWLYSYHDIAVHTKHRYTGRELSKLLANSGLRVLKTTYANMFLFPVSFILRMISKISSKKRTSSDVKPINSIVNRLFYLPLLLESILIKIVNLPFGLSVISVAQKTK